MNLPDSTQYKFHSVHSLFEPMHGYVLSITFGNAIDFHSMGLVNRKQRISTALNLRFRHIFILILIFIGQQYKGYKVLYLDFEMSLRQFSSRCRDENGRLYKFHDNFMRGSPNTVSRLKHESKTQLLYIPQALSCYRCYRALSCYRVIVRYRVIGVILR